MKQEISIEASRVIGFGSPEGDCFYIVWKADNLPKFFAKSAFRLIIKPAIEVIDLIFSLVSFFIIWTIGSIVLFFCNKVKIIAEFFFR